jgi:hypothetical protein
MRSKWKTWIDWVDENSVHVLIAVVGVAAAIVLNVAGVLRLTGLIDTTLGLLVVIAGALLFDRRARDQLESTVSTSTSSVEEAVTGARNGIERALGELAEKVERLQLADHYKVLSSASTWDITEGGAKAVTTKIRRLRFLRDRMVAVTDFGKVDEGTEAPPKVAAPFRLAGTIRDRTTGMTYMLVALDMVYGAGQEITTRVERTAQRIRE